MKASTSPGADSVDPATQSELRHLTKDESEDLDRARRGEKTRKILQDADVRDAEATARDAVADERARVADLKAFTDPGSIYPGQAERRAAAHDRADSKTDREFSAEDRRRLTEGDH
jgi:hypothetical protein